MSLLRINTINKLEFQKQSYQNLCNSILEVDGDFVPAWDFKPLDSSETLDHVDFCEINIDKLKSNKIIYINNFSTLTITVNLNNGYFYADKLIKPLEINKIYRIIIETNEESYYSELFKKI